MHSFIFCSFISISFSPVARPTVLQPTKIAEATIPNNRADTFSMFFLLNDVLIIGIHSKKHREFILDS